MLCYDLKSHIYYYVAIISVTNFSVLSNPTLQKVTKQTAVNSSNHNGQANLNDEVSLLLKSISYF